MEKSRGRTANVRDKLAQWDSHLAVLSEQQKESCMELSSSAYSRPLPIQVSTLLLQPIASALSAVERKCIHFV